VPTIDHQNRTDPAAPEAGRDRMPSPVEIADALFEVAARREVRAVTIEPGADGPYDVLVDGNEAATLPRGALPAEWADAVIARVALLARIDLAAPGESVRRLPVRLGETEVELLAIVNTRRRGLALELRRLAYQRGGAALRAAATPGDWRPPERVGPYRLEQALGRGGMGIVFRAEHVGLGKRFAIKILARNEGSSEEHVARFANEARTAGRLRHPGVVSVTDCGTMHDGVPYIVMELVEWPTLATLLKGGPLEPARAFAIAKNIAEPLHAVHEQGIVHRDLKPGNVFVGPEDAVKICDFGTAKLMSPPSLGLGDTQRGVYYGTPLYMSPEYACGTSTDRRADIYGLGCVLYEMLTGGVPFDGEGAFEVLIKHASSPIPVAASPFGPLPALAQKVIARALAKRPADRYETAAELMTDLERCAGALWRKGWRAWLPA
jgi:serine/threonine-protein kinase